MAIVWERNGDEYHATVESAAGGVRFRLVVERMDGSWDWTVWRPDHPTLSTRHGVADTVHEAMQAAESAAE
jgi:hypothetical protein